jgi:restriction endonuclease TaqI-like protein
MPSVSFESFEKELNQLVAIFARNLADLKSSEYVEAKLRDDFLNPFFRALGWDLENRAGLIQTKREVEIESRTNIGGRQKRADYLFRTDGHDRFVCEAKKPAEELHSRYAFQAKRYAWNKDLPVAILTDSRDEVLLYVEACPTFEKLPIGLRNHLEANSEDLKGRAAYKRGNCDWWRFTWPLHREYYSRPRLISPFLATENRFALVEDGKRIGLTDTIVLFDNGQPESLKYLLGLLNSRLLTLRFRSIGKLKGGGIYEYFWNSVSKLPIRRIDFSKPAYKTRHDRLVGLVDKLLVLIPRLRHARGDGERQTLQNAATSADQQIDALVYELYGLTEKEIKRVEGGQ